MKADLRTSLAYEIKNKINDIFPVYYKDYVTINSS